VQLSEKEWLTFFGPPRRRSWPFEPTRLEVLATKAGLDDEQLRELLRRLIADRLRAEARAEGERVELVCASCEQTFEVSNGRARAVARGEAVQLCRECRYPRGWQPTAADRRRVEELPAQALEDLAAAVDALR
jgi:hypothetical protein